MMGYYICKGFFDTISKSLDEAAMIDGASRNTIFWKIIMPLSKPIVIYTILTSFLGPWGDFMMANFLVARGAQDTWTVAVGMQNWLTIRICPITSPLSAPLAS
jgi:arabinogalactan oligomer/maltooligosaccharide transport system permease protein